MTGTSDLHLSFSDRRLLSTKNGRQRNLKIRRRPTSVIAMLFLLLYPLHKPYNP